MCQEDVLPLQHQFQRRLQMVWRDRRAKRKIRCITTDNESLEGKTVLIIYVTYVLPASHEQTLELNVLTACSDRGSLVVTGGPRVTEADTHNTITDDVGSLIVRPRLLLQFILTPPASLVKIVYFLKTPFLMFHYYASVGYVSCLLKPCLLFMCLEIKYSH